MPISKANRALYPKHWKQIRARILDRASVKYERIGIDAFTPRCECRGEPYKVYDMTTVDQSACPKCVMKTQGNTQRVWTTTGTGQKP